LRIFDSNSYPLSSTILLRTGLDVVPRKTGLISLARCCGTQITLKSLNKLRWAKIASD
jgi:hypothetical protein